MNNIIFLDIDDVLNRCHFNGKTAFSKDLVDNLRFILDNVKNSKIVMSSSWRTSSRMEFVSLEKNWRICLEDMLGMPEIIIDDIPTVNEFPEPLACTDKRGEDIALWLEKNRISKNVRNFVILDDSASCGTIPKLFPNNVIICDKLEPGEGLSMRNAKQAIWILENFGRERTIDENKTFFVSDTHFSHANIIKYCSRPFKTTEEMDEKMIDNWNNVVEKDDTVWHLGDFSFGKGNIEKIFPRLNGKLNIVLGNHDKKSVKFYYDLGFNRVYDHPVILENSVILSHEPLQWVKHPMFNIFGHVHDSKLYSTFSKTSCCVCVERHGYAPISMKQMKNEIEKISKNSELKMFLC